MNEKKRYCANALLFLACLAPGLAKAATLYEWVDKSGETHYGYRPPPGVIGTVVAEKAQQLRQSSTPLNCRELEQEHLRLIDKEIDRVKSLPDGLGLSFEFTPEAKQRFINDLLAHRAAFITGRAPEVFAAPDKKREIKDLKEKYQQDKERMLEDLQAQSRQLQQQRVELERERRENLLLFQRYRTLYPYPGLLYW